MPLFNGKLNLCFVTFKLGRGPADVDDDDDDEGYCLSGEHISPEHWHPHSASPFFPLQSVHRLSVSQPENGIFGLEGGQERSSSAPLADVDWPPVQALLTASKHTLTITLCNR